MYIITLMEINSLIKILKDKLTKKIIGKSYFKNVLPNFGYKNGFMTVENEIINLIYILKNFYVIFFHQLYLEFC